MYSCSGRVQTDNIWRVYSLHSVPHSEEYGLVTYANTVQVLVCIWDLPLYDFNPLYVGGSMAGKYFINVAHMGATNVTCLHTITLLRREPFCH